MSCDALKDFGGRQQPSVDDRYALFATDNLAFAASRIKQASRQDDCAIGSWSMPAGAGQVQARKRARDGGGGDETCVIAPLCEGGALRFSRQGSSPLAETAQPAWVARDWL